MGLSPQQAKILLDKNGLNLAEKLKSGKTLTPREVEMLEQIAATGAELNTKPWAANQVELAEALGVDRKTIQRWSKEADCPGHEPNGNYNIQRWRKWAADHGKRKGHDDGDDIDAVREKAISLKLANERLRNRIAIEKDEWMPRVVAKQVFSKLVVECKARNYAAIVRFVTLARMAPDTTAAIESVRKEMDEIWKAMTDSRWFHPPQD
jgi:hypothetical protein